MSKIAFITGVSGQDGSYLLELLLKKNYIVHGMLRRSSSFNTARIDHLTSHKNYHGHYGDLCDTSSLTRLIKSINPDEIYNLGAQSHVAVSFEIPEFTADVTALGTLRLLEAILHINKKIKFYQASTSEIFGGDKENFPQDEESPKHPKSPYAAAKLYAYNLTKNYREAYDIFASNGILFNHESPRRGGTFVTKKITAAVANIYNQKNNTIKLGNLDAVRDWGYAKEYVLAMWQILQHDKPDDFVVATGKSISVRDFLIKCFNFIEIEIEWQGEGVNEKGINKSNGDIVVEIDKRYFRPLETNYLQGNFSKIKNEIGWIPETNIDQLIEIMMKSELSRN